MATVKAIRPEKPYRAGMGEALDSYNLTEKPKPVTMAPCPVCGYRIRSNDSYESEHLAADGVQWAPGESNDLGWTAPYGITRPMTPGETLKAIRGDDDIEEDAR